MVHYSASQRLVHHKQITDKVPVLSGCSEETIYYHLFPLHTTQPSSLHLLMSPQCHQHQLRQNLKWAHFCRCCLCLKAGKLLCHVHGGGWACGSYLVWFFGHWKTYCLFLDMSKREKTKESLKLRIPMKGNLNQKLLKVFLFLFANHNSLHLSHLFVTGSTQYQYKLLFLLNRWTL